MSSQAPTRRIRVALIFGGRSSEHAISCVTAAGVMRAIDPAKYEVVPVGISADGRWVLASGDPAHWEIADGRLPAVSGAGTAVTVPLSTGSHELVALGDGGPGAVLGGVDVVFPLLHGPFGEDGTLQGMLELADIPYVGDGVFASAACMDKHFMKVVLASAGLPVGPYVTVRAGQWDADPQGVTDRVAALGWPVFVKPARAGSSVGITRVTGPEGLAAAIDTAREHDPKLVIEAEIRGREIECGVLGDLGGGRATASVPGEVVAAGGHEFYDFEAKYLDESGSRLSCPADLDPEAAERVRELAVRAFEAFDGEGLARVDFFLTEDGRLVVNELNTMPGFTPISMYPRMWQATGLGYPELIDRLLQLALHRKTGLR